MISVVLFDTLSFFLAKRSFYLSLLYESPVCPFPQNRSAVFQHFHCFTAVHPLSFTDYGRIVALSCPLVNVTNTTFPWDFFMKTTAFCKRKLCILHLCKKRRQNPPVPPSYFDSFSSVRQLLHKDAKLNPYVASLCLHDFQLPA